MSFIEQNNAQAISACEDELARALSAFGRPKEECTALHSCSAILRNLKMLSNPWDVCDISGRLRGILKFYRTQCEANPGVAIDTLDTETAHEVRIHVLQLHARVMALARRVQ